MEDQVPLKYSANAFTTYVPPNSSCLPAHNSGVRSGIPAALQPHLLQHQPPKLDWRFLMPWWKVSGRRFASKLREVAADVNVDLDDALTVPEFVRHARLGHGQCSVPARLLQRLPAEQPLTRVLAVFDDWDKRHNGDLLDADGERESVLPALFGESAVESPALARVERAAAQVTKAPRQDGPRRTRAPASTASADVRRAASVKRAPRARAIIRPAPRRLSRVTSRQGGREGAADLHWLRAWSVLLRHVSFQEEHSTPVVLRGEACGESAAPRRLTAATIRCSDASPLLSLIIFRYLYVSFSNAGY